MPGRGAAWISVLAWGARGRGFKSRRPDHLSHLSTTLYRQVVVQWLWLDKPFVIRFCNTFYLLKTLINVAHQNGLLFCHGLLTHRFSIRLNPFFHLLPGME